MCYVKSTLDLILSIYIPEERVWEGLGLVSLESVEHLLGFNGIRARRAYSPNLILVFYENQLREV